MGARSKQKGNRGELIIARILSSWWMEDLTLLKAKADDLPIRRTPGSGGWAKGKGLGGDLVPVTDDAMDFADIWSVEVKNREEWFFHGAFTQKKWCVDLYWEQCVGDANIAGVCPLLVFTKNRQPWYVRVRTCHYKKLLMLKGASFAFNDFFVYGKCVIGQLDSFIKTFSREECLNALKK